MAANTSGTAQEPRPSLAAAMADLHLKEEKEDSSDVEFFSDVEVMTVDMDKVTSDGSVMDQPAVTPMTAKVAVAVKPVMAKVAAARLATARPPLRRPRPEQPDKLEVSRFMPTTSLEATKLLAAGGRHPEPEELDGGGETPAEAAEGPSNMGVVDQAPDGLRIYGSRKDKLPQPPDMSEQLSVQQMQLLGKLPKEEPRVLESGEVVTVVAEKGYGFIRYR